MAASPSSFPVDRLRYKDSLIVLVDLRKRCSRNSENKKLCLLICDQLDHLHTDIASLAPGDPLKRKYVDVIVRYTQLTHREPLLMRLGTTGSTLFKIRELQVHLDDIATALGVVGMPQWQDGWSAACAAQRSRLVDVISHASDRILVNELRGDKVEETLRTLHAAILGSSESPQFIKFIQDTFDRITKFTDNKGLEMFNWFIPRASVQIVGDSIGNGTFGDVWHGTLTRDGVEQKVVVKKLFKEVTSDSSSSELFLNQLQFWDGLMKNKQIPKTHILKLYGGVHIGDPLLFVCEDATHGNLMEFLAKEENKPLFWPMFLQVAAGLKTLHSNNVVHSGLKCHNILVTEGNVVKLSDFGFSFIRSLSVNLSSNKDKAMADAVRWKPKEMLEEVPNPEFRFAADIYALGMCMIEAITQEPPFGMDADEDVTNRIMSGAGHPRPDDVSEEAWGLITGLCHSDCEKRPTLDEAMRRISELAGMKGYHECLSACRGSEAPLTA